MFSAQPAIASNGTLTYTLAATGQGTATVSVVLQDNGGTANGGVDSTSPRTFTITTTTAVANVAPSFTAGSNQTVLEDGGLVSVPTWATSISAGPPSESGQALDFIVSNDNPTLFSAQPAVAPNGTLTFTPAADAYGSAIVSVSLHDNGGTANGGVDVSGVQTFAITVTPVNDPPRFDPVQGLHQVAAGAGAQTVPAWVTGISAGPANESAQSVVFLVTVDNDDLFSVQPGISPDGTLSFTPAPGATGNATVTVRARDDGGTANGGNDTSPPQSFVILVTTAECVAEPANAISWWAGDFDVIAPDLRGGNNGSPQGNVQTAAGIVGTAFSFDRSAGSGILVANAANLTPGTNQITMAAWVRPAATVEDYQAIVRKTGSYSLGLTNNASAVCEIGTAPSLVGGPVQAGRWTHVACTYDGDTTRLFVDGAQVASIENELGIAPNTTALMIGGDAVTTHNEFNGLIDEVMIFSRALTAQELTGIVGAGDAGVCVDSPVVAISDVAATSTDTPLTFTPNANDRDPDAGFPSVLTTVRGVTAGAPVLTGHGDLAVVQSTGLGYLSGGVMSALGIGVIGILDTNTNALIGSMPMPVPSALTLSLVNQATNIVYMRGTTLNAVDGRSASPTFNQVILSLALGSVQSMAIDEARGRVYLTSSSASPGALAQSQIIVIDADPSSSTFHQVLSQIPAPGGGTALSLAVNGVTNRIFIAVNGGSASGVYAMDGVTHQLTLIPLTSNPSNLVVNPSSNLVYAVSGSSLYAIDGASNTRLALITLPGSAAQGNLDTRLAVHNATGHVYARLAEFPGISRLAVVDGNRSSATFNTILTLLPIGREDGQTMVRVDQTANRVITTSRSDLRTTIVDALDHSIVAAVQSTLPPTRITLDPAHNRAYVTGGATIIRSIDVTTGLQQIVPVAAEMGYVAVDPISHTGFVAQTLTGAAVARVNENGPAGNVVLAHSDGREVFAVRNSVTNRIYTLNTAATVAGGSDALPGFVRVIDGFSNTVIASVPVGPFPFGIGIDETRNKIYVGNGSDGAAFPGGISIIDGVDHSVVQADMSRIPATSTTPGQISVGRDIVPNPATGKVYFRITSGSTTQFGVLDSVTHVATPFPEADGSLINIIRVNPVLNRIYVGEQFQNGDPGMVHVINGANDEVLASLTAGSPSPFVGTQNYLAVDRTSGRVFVADYNNDSLTVIDGATNTVIATVRVGDGPGTVAVNHALNRIYVGSALDKTLTIIDGATLRVAAALPLPLAPVGLEVDETAAQIYAVGSSTEPGIMVIADPGTEAPEIVSVADGAFGTVVLNADGSVTYTPDAGFNGSDSFTYTIADGVGGFTTGTVSVTVASTPSILTAALPATTVGDAYAQTLAATGGTSPYAWSVSSNQIPGGLTLNAVTGVLSGIAVQSGTFAFTIQARDSALPSRTATRDYTINVGPPVIVTTFLPSGFIGAPYSATVVVGGATGAVQWTLDTGGSPLLDWLSISNAGVLSGTPPNPGTTPPLTVRATDALGQVASRSLTLFVGAPLDISPTQLREGVVLETQVSLPLVGGNGTRAVTLTGGTLPPGLTLNANGTFTGTPRRHGTFNFTVQATDCTPSTTCLNTVVQQTVSRALTLRVSAKDQQVGSQTQPPISFGGPGGRRIAQVVTVGAHGTLTGIGLQNISCPSSGPVRIDIQRLTESGLPDGTTIATGTAVNNLLGAISLEPAIALPIGAQFAFIINSPTACTLTNAGVTDLYNAGDAYADAGSGWASLFSTDGRYDVPSFRTLIQPAMEVGYLTNARNAGAAATLLNNGTVLLTGTGASAEIYDPSTNSSTLTGSMSVARSQHTATLLQDGTVLVVGGQLNGTRQASAETYDPATGTFTVTAGPMSVGRDSHAATRMNDGRVLITGGNINVGITTQAVASAEIYDPVSRTFTAAPDMTSTRQFHNSVLLQSGRVLVASGYIGGSSSRTAELYDPATNTFTATAGSMSMARGFSAATMLTDGRVLITGGQNGPPRNTAEIYDPVTDNFSTVGTMLTTRYQHSATRLADGSVLVAGGFDEVTNSSYVLPLASLERFDPATNSFALAGGMEARRARQNAILLPNGTVFVAGGAGQSWMTANTGEIYSASAAPALTMLTLPDGQVGAAYPATTLIGIGGSGAPYQIALASGILPPGLTLSGATLSGTPTANGAYPIGLRVTDSLNNSTVVTLTIRIGAALTITSPYNLTSGALNRPYSVQLTAVGVEPILWTLAPASSALPPGLFLNSGGSITGTPIEATFRDFIVRAVDALGRSALRTFSISIQNPLDITTTVLAEAAVRENYNFCLSSINGVTSNTWSVVGGTMPPGVTLLANGCFSNAPTALGTFTPQVRVSDLASPPQVVTRDLTIRVSAREQQGFSQTQPAIAFGGAGGRRLAQTITVGASGTLTAFGFNSTTNCQAPVTVDVQRLDSRGAPDGVTIASGSLWNGLSGIPIAPAVNFGIGDRIAFVLSSTSACTIANVPAFDSYQAGEGFADAGSGWVSLVNSDGRYDLPFRSLIEPSGDVVFLHRSRGNLESTRLSDGRVLMTGNDNTAEVFDPVTRTTILTGAMSSQRSGHTGTLLPDGTVLIAGGRDFSGNRLATAEIYNPATGTFALTSGPMSVPHEDHTATLMNDGRVLIAGGLTQIGAVYQSIGTAEIYDPSSGSFTPAGTMLTERHNHTAVLLASGRVLLIGGFTSGPVFRSAELYDPITGTFTATAGSMSQARGRAAVAPLADGRILITGGHWNDIVNTAEIYNPATDSFAPTGSMLSRRHEHTATALADGSVLVTGGSDQDNSADYILGHATMERWVPGSNTFVPAGSLVARHRYHAATVAVRWLGADHRWVRSELDDR